MTSTSNTTDQSRLASAASSIGERLGSAATVVTDRAKAAKAKADSGDTPVNPTVALVFLGLAVLGAGKVLGLGFRGTRAGVRRVRARRA